MLCPGSVPRLSCVPQAHVREGDCFFFFFSLPGRGFSCKNNLGGGAGVQGVCARVSVRVCVSVVFILQ